MKLEEQNRSIKERWSKIYPEIDNDDSISPPILKESLEDKKFDHYNDAIDSFITKNEDTIKDRKIYKSEFDEFYDNEGRLPKRYNKPMYYMWLVFLIILEIPTNYTTIEQFLHKPVVSTMITISIGVLLVFIAHSHGAFFKQLSFINNTSSYIKSYNTTPKTTRYVYAIFGFIAMTIVMYGLYYARLQYFQPPTFDDPFSDASSDLVSATILTKVGILMMANFAIYILGVITSYIVHEVLPDFQESYYKYQKFQSKFLKEYIEFKKQLDAISKARTIRGK